VIERNLYSEGYPAGHYPSSLTFEY